MDGFDAQLVMATLEIEVSFCARETIHLPRVSIRLDERISRIVDYV